MKVFVSYRREDTGHVVDRLCRRLEQAFGDRGVFYDMDSVGAGVDFLGTVGGAIFTSDAILIVIGPRWASIADSRGVPRLQDDDDPVRLEVSLAINSQRTLIPLLVDGAEMPSKHELRPELHHLTTRSGLRLDSGVGFDADVDDLIQRLGGPVARAAPAFPGVRSPRKNVAWTSFEGMWQTQDGRHDRDHPGRHHG